jgi:hypothetical protein
MKRWILLLAGPLIWAGHFLVAYVISSVSVLVTGETTLLARAGIVAAGLGAAGLAVVAGRLALSLQGGDISTFWRTVSAFGAVMGGIAALWQSAPALAPI